jgi:hypothetical protein
VCKLASLDIQGEDVETIPACAANRMFHRLNARFLFKSISSAAGILPALSISCCSDLRAHPEDVNSFEILCALFRDRFEGPEIGESPVYDRKPGLSIRTQPSSSFLDNSRVRSSSIGDVAGWPIVSKEGSATSNVRVNGIPSKTSH